MKCMLAPSILSADFSALGRDVVCASKAGAQYVHIDVMDGLFVPSISLGTPVIKAIRPLTDAVFDVHLMIENPGRYVADFAKSGADILTVHAEACVHLDRTLQAVKETGCKAAVALNPVTPLCALDYVMDKLDMVLIMSVNPGYGGQAYIEAMTEKIRALRKKLDDAGLQRVDIEVDGGINSRTVRTVLDAGANVLVAGSAVYGGDEADITKKVQDFLAVMKTYES